MLDLVPHPSHSVHGGDSWVLSPIVKCLKDKTLRASISSVCLSIAEHSVPRKGCPQF